MAKSKKAEDKKVKAAAKKAGAAKKAAAAAKKALTAAENKLKGYNVGAGNAAHLKQRLAAGKRVFIVTEVSTKTKFGTNEFLHFSKRLGAELKKWKALAKADAALAKKATKKGAKAAWATRLAADKASVAAVTTYKAYFDGLIKKWKKDKKTKLSAAKFTAAEKAYRVAYLKATLKHLKALESLDKANKKKYAAYAKQLTKSAKVAKVKLVEAKKKVKAEDAAKTKGTTAKKGGNTGLIVGIVVAVVALVAIVGLMKWKKKGCFADKD